MVRLTAIRLVEEIIDPNRQINTVKIGMSARVNETSKDVFIVLLLDSIIRNSIPLIFGSKNLKRLLHRSCPKIKNAMAINPARITSFFELFIELKIALKSRKGVA